MTSQTSMLPKVHEEESSPLQRAVAQLLDIQEQLGPLNQRWCTEDSLSTLINDLQNISQEIRSIPLEIIQLWAIPKKALLSTLRSAYIELLLALDLLTTKGRTRGFYKHLSICQEYIERAVTYKIEREAISLPSNHDLEIQKTPSGSLFTLVQHYSADILESQAILECEYEALEHEDEPSRERYNAILAALSTLSIPVRALCRLLNETPCFSEEPSLFYYQLQINLCYVGEQADKLKMLIRAFHSGYDPSSRQAKKISLEILHTLKSLLRCNNDVSPTVTGLIDQMRFYGKSGPKLRLIVSPNYIVETLYVKSQNRRKKEER
jgi:hypothetical protein